MDSQIYNTTILCIADCLDVLKEWYNIGIRSCIDLIYIDPPFNSNQNYNIGKTKEIAFKDTWSKVAYLDEMQQIASISPNIYSFLKLLEAQGLPKGHISYLTMMAIRCYYMRKMLKDTGSFYFHCDPTMSHYVKIILDYIFGHKNFRNEIVWWYKRWSNVSKNFQRMHDVIFYYSKTKNNKFNIQYQNYSNEKYIENTVRGIVNGKLQRLKDDNGTYIQRRKENKGVALHDVWELQNIAPTSKERLGYPTQKPEKLIERIIKASTNEGDVVADFFMGGGTTISVAQKLKRIGLGVDINYRAVQITKKRLENSGFIFGKDFKVLGFPNSSKELRKMVDDNMLGEGRNSRFVFEDVIVKYYLKDVVGNDKKVGDNSIDGRFIFEHKKDRKMGLVQVTTGANINHFKAFCSEVGDGKQGDLGVYITFDDRITSGMRKKAKEMGKIGNVDKIQILTVEDLIDNKKYFSVPTAAGVFF